MERTTILSKIGGRQAIANHHISLVIQHSSYHCRCTMSWISVISIGNDIAVGIHLAKHTTNHIPFTLLLLIPYYSTSIKGFIHSAVGRVVVIDIDISIR